MPALILQMIGADSALVKNVINLVAGVPFDPGPGLVVLNVPNGTYVGPGFIGTLANGVWAWAAPPVNEEPPVAVSVPAQLEALEASNAAIAEQLVALRATLS